MMYVVVEGRLEMFAQRFEAEGDCEHEKTRTSLSKFVTFNFHHFQFLAFSQIVYLI